ANTVRRRMLPPANKSKNPKMVPLERLKNSVQRSMWMPGVGIWAPNRYTASRPNVKKTLLRRSGTRKIFANASKSLFIRSVSRRALLSGADHFGRSPRSLNLIQRGFREVVRRYLDLAGQLAGTENLQAVAHLLDYAQLDQTVGIEAVAFELLQPPQIHNSV